MLDREFEREIAKQLGDGRRPDDLIVFVCERTGLEWDAAREEILRVRSTYRESITRRRTWVLFAAWIPTLIGGCFATLGLLLGPILAPGEFFKNLVLHPGLLAEYGAGVAAFCCSVAVWFRKKKPFERRNS